MNVGDKYHDFGQNQTAYCIECTCQLPFFSKKNNRNISLELSGKCHVICCDFETNQLIVT